MGLFLLGALACAAPPAPQTGAPVPSFCDEAAARMGRPGQKVERCEPQLPDQYWVILLGDGGYAGTVVVRDGQPDGARGLAAGAAWLTRIGVTELPTINPVNLAVGLEWLAALPEGFMAQHLTDSEDRTGATRFSSKPFRLELRRVEVFAPAPGADLGLPRGHGGGGVQAQVRAVLTAPTPGRFTWSIERRGSPAEPWVAQQELSAP